ncbi:MAG TPA: hypothetical protein ENG63_07115 [Candidatus Desulfofervidus auxilii]|uniref:Uncharacterized protein n=1 Tax=Desulfofervidus auxilii TaxID=1621989 RepID=A0A7C0YA01_DESA2|nr:hypothetical protein [Candidatus Desulfofervidus auxilii]
MAKKILGRIYGAELKENIPVLLVSVLEREEKKPERIVLEIKQVKKENPEELLSGKWFKVNTSEFFNVIYRLCRLYFIHLLRSGVSIEHIRDTIFDIVRKSLYYAHKEFKSEEDKRIVRKDIL